MDATSAIESVFREDSGRIIASLIRISGSFDRAEEAVQEAFAAAMTAWPERGIPQNPAAWIMTAAHRKLIDQGRHEKTKRDKEDSLRYEIEVVNSPTIPMTEEEFMHLPDDRLRLIFTCCHPALNREAQVALTLRTLGGLTTPEIAKAFLLPEATLAQRLVRAKRKIAEARIPYEVPPPEALPDRLLSAQEVIYLIFNEGYTAASGSHLVRHDLCNEAIRLGRVLCTLLPKDAESLGLLTLMLLHDARREARVKDGRLVTLEEQDRSLWDQSKIAEGTAYLEQALRLRRIGPYQLQAAIIAVHCQAKTPEQTDWRQIAGLYTRLLEINPSPVIALNRAVAVAMGQSLEAGLKEVDEIGSSGDLENYYLFHATRADILRRMGNREQAAASYQRALQLTTNVVEQAFLTRRLQETRGASAK
ncbi:MAG TPA: RNA polymerase sigma factor [Terriglobales bacterium]|nr:RNA polymerase sigma factor [Terriglobales bacterium]